MMKQKHKLLAHKLLALALALVFVMGTWTNLVLADDTDTTPPPNTEDELQVPLTTPEPKPLHTITILYVSKENPQRTLAKAFEATVYEGFEYRENVTSPAVDDYELVDPTQAVINLDFAQVTEDKTIEVVYKPIEVSYKISHFKEDLEGNFVLEEEETAQAKIGTEVTPNPKIYDGFSFQGLQETYTVPKVNDELQIELKYTRNSYQISFDSDGGTAVPGGIFKYEADLAGFKAQISQPTKPGYSFVRWETSDPSIPEMPEKMPAQDLTFKAVWQEGEATPYLIRYFVQNANDDNYSLAGSYRMLGKTGESITAPEDLANPHPGLVFPDLSKNEQQYWSWCFVRNVTKTTEANQDKTITADGLATIDVYYDRKELEVRYLSDGGTWFPEISKNGKTYNQDNPYSMKVRLGKDLSSDYVLPQEVQNIPDGKYIYTNLLYVTKNGEENTRLMPKSYSRAGTEWFFHGRKYGEIPNQYLKMTFLLLNDSGSVDNPSVQPLKIYIFMEHLQDGQNISAGYSETADEIRTWPESTLIKGIGGLHFQGFYADPAKLKTYPSGVTAWEIKTKTENGKTIRYSNAYYKRNAYPLELHSDPANWTYVWSNPKLEVLYGVSLMDLPEVQQIPSPPESIRNLQKTYNSEYRFAGWYLDPGYNEKLGPDTKMRDSGTSHLYAKWVPKTETVTLSFDVDGGSAVENQTIPWGTKPTVVENPTKEGYRFLGWKEKQVGGNLANYYFRFNQVLYQDVQLQAIWEEVTSTKLTIRYVKGTEQQEDEVIATETVQGQKVGAIYTAQAKLVDGYLPDKVHKTLTLGQDGNVITFYYKPFETVDYTINYIAKTFENGEEVKKSLDKVTVTTKKAIDTQNYKAFPGYTPVDIQQVLILSQDATTNVMTFRYTKVADATYKVEYYLSDGLGDYQLIEALTETIGAVPGSKVTVTPAEVLTYSEHQYNYVAAKSNSEGIVTADNSLVLKLYYQAEPVPSKEYTITFDANGGTLADGNTISSSTYVEGTSITIMAAPTRAGYRFLYWQGSEYYPGQAYTVTDNHTFTAIWEESSEPGEPNDPDHPDYPSYPNPNGSLIGPPRPDHLANAPLGQSRPDNLVVIPLGQSVTEGAKNMNYPNTAQIAQLPATGSVSPGFSVLFSLGLTLLGLVLKKRR